MITIGADHAGVKLKDEIVRHLAARGVAVEDAGTHDTNSCDYPDFAFVVARAVADGKAPRGILVCGTGTGMAIAANKVLGVRAAMCCTEIQARFARAHNDANVLCLGERLLGGALAVAIVDAFLDTDFEGQRHAARLAKITSAEQEQSR